MAAAGIRLGDALFDPASGDLLTLGDLPVDPVRVDIWRAPIDTGPRAGDSA